MNTEALESVLGEYKGCIHKFNRYENYEKEGIHTFDIIKNYGGRGYYGVSGPATDGSIDLWRSDDISSWTKLTKKLRAKDGMRWPTAIKNNNGIDILVQQRNGLFERLIHKILGENQLFATGYWRIDWYRYKNGKTEFKETIIDKRYNGLRSSSNPYITKVEGKITLTYFGKRDGEWLILVRQADNIESLSESSDLVIRHSEQLLAAPSLVRHPVKGIFILFTERFDKESGKWVTTMATNDSLDKSFKTVNEKVVFKNNVACPFLFVDDRTDNIYLFVCRQNKRTNDSLLHGEWLGMIHKFNTQ